MNEDEMLRRLEEFAARKDSEMAAIVLREYKDKQTAFDKVCRLSTPALWSWQGRLVIRFPQFTIRGPGSIEVTPDEIRGEINREKLESAHVESVYELTSSAGKILGTERYGNATPEGTAGWTASGVYGNNLDFPMVSTAPFRARRLCVKFSNERTSVMRYLYRGVRLDGGNATTVLLGEDGIKAKIDSFDVSIFNRKLRLRQIHDADEQQAQVVAAIVDGEELSENEQHYLWLLLILLCGNRPQQAIIESYDANAELTERIYRGDAVTFSRNPHPPIQLKYVARRWRGDVVGALGEALKSRVDEGYPLEIVLSNLSDANEASLTNEIKDLLSVIHTLFEEWAIISGKHHLMRRKEFERRVRPIKEAIDVEFADNETMQRHLRERINTSNKVSAGLLQEWFFQALNIPLNDLGREALELRDFLFHHGYITKGDVRLPPDELQHRIDQANALRTLANRAILKLLGYEGEITDYAHGYRSVPI